MEAPLEHISLVCDVSHNVHVSTSRTHLSNTSHSSATFHTMSMDAPFEHISRTHLTCLRRFAQCPWKHLSHSSHSSATPPPIHFTLSIHFISKSAFDTNCDYSQRRGSCATPDQTEEAPLKHISLVCGDATPCNINTNTVILTNHIIVTGDIPLPLIPSYLLLPISVPQQRRVIAALFCRRTQQSPNKGNA
jgi:hypothetical protein